MVEQAAAYGYVYEDRRRRRQVEEEKMFFILHVADARVQRGA